MITLLRIASTLTGSLLIIVGLPICLLAAAVPQGEPYMSTFEIVGGLFALLCAFTSGFFFVGLHGAGIFESGARRLIAGVLLLVPLASTGVVLLSSHREVWPFAIPLFAISLLLFGMFAWPAFLFRQSDRQR